jgi:hypothetical protein
MQNLINKLADKVNELETEQEILAMIEGASIATDTDYTTLKKQVQNAYYLRYQKAQVQGASEEAVYNCANVN